MVSRRQIIKWFEPASFSNSLSFLQLGRYQKNIFIVSHRKLYNVQAIRTNANAITGDALFLPSTKETEGKGGNKKRILS